MFFRKYRQDFNFFSTVIQPIEIVGHLEPLNYFEEKEKWLKSPGKTYNPQFTYSEIGIRRNLYLAKKLRHSIDGITNLYLESADWRSILTSQLLTYQREDLDATIPFLEAIVKGKIPNPDIADKTVGRLFGRPTQSELDVLSELTYKRSHPKDVILEHLIGENERHIYSRTKLESIVHTFCHDFEGILTPEENDILIHKKVTTEQAIELTQQILAYIDEHTTCGEAHVKINYGDKIENFGVTRNSLKASSVIFEIPSVDSGYSADYVLQTFAHELNSHLRAIVSTAELTKKLPIHFQTILISRNQRMLAQEGFATLNGDAVIEASQANVVEPMLVLAATYASEGHNFAETVHFIYDTYDIDPDDPNETLQSDIWTIAQFFDGIKDTSAHSGYTFPWRQVYAIGPLRTLRELCRKDENRFEDPLSMMRYSELPFPLIRNINHIEYDLREKLAPDPFEHWDFANPNPDTLDITGYTKQLLLDL